MCWGRVHSRAHGPDLKGQGNSPEKGTLGWDLRGQCQAGQRTGQERNCSFLNWGTTNEREQEVERGSEGWRIKRTKLACGGLGDRLRDKVERQTGSSNSGPIIIL